MHAKDHALSASERWAWSAVALIGLLVRLVYLRHYRFDSDEPQHLHVAWGWMRGQLPYRDFFDNHTPLFHILTAPVLRLVGERADALVWMRLALLPLYLGSLACLAVIGARLFGRRIGLWGALLAGLFPYYFYPSLEFRTDNLWGPVWLAMLVVLLLGRLSPGRCFAAGLLLGVGFCVSMKTVLMLMALVCAAVFLHLVLPELRRAAAWRRLAALGTAGLAGMAIPPAMLAAYFQAHGALGLLAHYAVKYNLGKADPEAHGFSVWKILALLSLPLLWAGAVRLVRGAEDPARARRQVFLSFVAAFYILLLLSFWKELTRQDFIPFYPLLLLLLTPLLLRGGARLLGQGTEAASGPMIPLAMAGLEMLWILLGRPIGVDGTRGQVQFVAEVLALTGPEECVMDFKGESIFRQRPTRLVFEPVTRDLLKLGFLKDDVVPGLISTRTHVALSWTRRLPHAAEDFIHANFLRIGQSSVSGQFLVPREGRTFAFHLAIPGDYAFLTPAGPAAGLLDGQPCPARVSLAAGDHEFVAQEEPSKLAILWARAAELGFTPFAPPPFQRFESEF